MQRVVRALGDEVGVAGSGDGKGSVGGREGSGGIRFLWRVGG